MYKSVIIIPQKRSKVTILGKRCCEIANSLDFKLDAKWILHKPAWQGGKVRGLINLAFGELKRKTAKFFKLNGYVL